LPQSDERKPWDKSKTVKESNMKSIDTEIFPQILDSLNNVIVFVDNDHIIRYVNAAAREKHAKLGDIIGKSIFFCHNENSCRLIKEYYEKMKNGTDEILVAAYDTYRVVMRSVRSTEGKLMGYYEKIYTVD
jgi:DUF438 domain-containing protein